MLINFTVGRKGFVTYLKSLDEGTLEIIPSNGSIDGSPMTERRLKVICGT